MIFNSAAGSWLFLMIVFQSGNNVVIGSNSLWHQRIFYKSLTVEMLSKCMFSLYRFMYHDYAHFKIFFSIFCCNIYIYIYSDFSVMHTILEIIQFIFSVNRSSFCQQLIHATLKKWTPCCKCSDVHFWPCPISNHITCILSVKIHMLVCIFLNLRNLTP